MMAVGSREGVIARLLIVEDHPLYRDGFAAMAAGLRPDWRLYFADSISGTQRMLADQVFDVVIIDVGLRSEDGVALASLLRSTHPELLILMMSGRSDVSLQRRAEVAGAQGFVTKDGSAQEIVVAIDRVLGGGRAFARADTSAGDGERPHLTPRQADVLSLLAQGHANKEIRYRLGIAERTVRAHMTELFLILGATSRTHALVRARALGLID